MLIDQLGNKTGICSIDDALEAAKAASLDLVQVSPSDSKPVVCKILDYGKHLLRKKEKFVIITIKQEKINCKRNQIQTIN